MEIVTATNLQYADISNTLINMDAEFTETGVIPFTASANDAEAHGVTLHENAVAGNYGAIAAYSAIVTTTEMVKIEARRRIELYMPRWMVDREVSGGTAITASIKTYAADIRTESAVLEGTLPEDYATNEAHWTSAPT